MQTEIPFLDLKWQGAEGAARFTVIWGLDSPGVLLGVDTMRPLGVWIDVGKGLALPRAPVSSDKVPASVAPAGEVRFIHCTNPIGPFGTGIPIPETPAPPFPNTLDYMKQLQRHLQTVRESGGCREFSI